MSGLERWRESAKKAWGQWRIRLARLVSGLKIAPDQLADADPVARWRALRALMQTPRPDLLPVLLALAEDPDELVRAEVADVLVSWGPDVALEPVRGALADHPAPASAEILLTILARLPDPAHRDALRPWLEHEDAMVRAAAFMALAALCENSDLPQLEEALAEGEIHAQRAILTTLCAPEAGPLAERALASSDPIVRQRAAQAGPRIQRNLEAAHKAEKAQV